jgi:3-methyladenine DNA glycosylase Mpg
MAEWTDVTHALPNEGVVVETKIDDEHGCRNVQALKRRGYLWFLPDGSVYVYYIPTHWRPKE